MSIQKNYEKLLTKLREEKKLLELGEKKLERLTDIANIVEAKLKDLHCELDFDYYDTCPRCSIVDMNNIVLKIPGLSITIEYEYQIDGTTSYWLQDTLSGKNFKTHTEVLNYIKEIADIDNERKDI